MERKRTALGSLAVLAAVLGACQPPQPPPARAPRALPVVGVAAATPTNETALYLVVRDATGAAVRPGVSAAVSLTVSGPAGWNGGSPLQFRWPVVGAGERPGVENMYLIPTPPSVGAYTVSGEINGAPVSGSFALASTQPVLTPSEPSVQNTGANSVEFSVPNPGSLNRVEVVRGEDPNGPVVGAEQESEEPSAPPVAEDPEGPPDNGLENTPVAEDPNAGGLRAGMGPARVLSVLPAALRPAAGRVRDLAVDGKLTVTTPRPLVKGETYTVRVVTSGFAGGTGTSVEALAGAKLDVAVTTKKIVATQGANYRLDASVGRLFRVVNGDRVGMDTVFTVRPVAPDGYPATSDIGVGVTGPDGSGWGDGFLPKGTDPALVVEGQTPACVGGNCGFTVNGFAVTQGIGVDRDGATLADSALCAPPGGRQCAPVLDVSVAVFAPLADGSGWTVRLAEGNSPVRAEGHLVYVREQVRGCTASGTGCKVVARARIGRGAPAFTLKSANGGRVSPTTAYELLVLSTNAPILKPTREWNFATQFDWLRQVQTAYRGATAEYPVPWTDRAMPEPKPHSIAAGPDGNMWFTTWDGSKIGRVTPAGAVTLFGTPTPGTVVSDIAAGPDGAMWYTKQTADPANATVGRITTAGSAREFPIPGGGSPTLIAAGSDGKVWFAEWRGNRIGRVTPQGGFEWFSPRKGVVVHSIAPGPDGRMWFTQFGAKKIGALSP